MKITNDAENHLAFINLSSVYFATKDGYGGGVYESVFRSVRAIVNRGAKTGALPDGRNAGEELSENASAVPGMDKKGVTAVVEASTIFTRFLISVPEIIIPTLPAFTPQRQLG